ncbi:MAG TPA: hypothetical protein VMR81_06545 [Patescibacteria group bacterium]|nr:hypothetical protein [Patescibacteria group bacterium]
MRRIHFYHNTKDETHCYQASLRMILKYFLPHENFTFKQLDVMTGKKEGLWSWIMQGAIALKKRGFEIKDIESFDYKSFLHSPKEYLHTLASKDVVDTWIQYSDIEAEKRNAEKFIKEVEFEKRQPHYRDIIDLLGKKYLLICNINIKTLNRKMGYAGHFVLIFRATEHTIWLHDPGLPPRKKRRVTRRVFEEAWAYPNEKAKNIVAFKR